MDQQRLNWTRVQVKCWYLPSNPYPTVLGTKGVPLQSWVPSNTEPSRTLNLVVYCVDLFPPEGQMETKM